MMFLDILFGVAAGGCVKVLLRLSGECLKGVWQSPYFSANLQAFVDRLQVKAGTFALVFVVNYEIVSFV